MYKTLIVDDREIFLMELSRLPVWGESYGFVIAGRANNGKKALEMLNNSSYDLVITDIRMPIMDGLQLLYEIKTKNLCPCVILLSEYSEFQYARQGIIYGAFDYLVKPATEEELVTLLKRAKNYLDNLPASSPFHTRDFSEGSWSYPVSEETKLVRYFKEKNPALIGLFQTVLEQIYKIMGDNLIKADLMIKKFYHNIISEVYKEYSWLSLYISIQYLDQIDYIREGDENAIKSFYVRKIAGLLQFITRLEPPVEDSTLKNIITYILNNPEANLKLKVLAARFYLNSTYLSNTFHTKTGIHFNDYITLVKMSRAEYLFKYTEEKIYEISYRLGYKDINYFSRQFKKNYGLSPTEYRNSKISDYQI
jgi:two-component system, response regulator YesN